MWMALESVDNVKVERIPRDCHRDFPPASCTFSSPAVVRSLAMRRFHGLLTNRTTTYQRSRTTTNHHAESNVRFLGVRLRFLSSRAIGPRSVCKASNADAARQSR
jgi:hypothetical protein